MVIEIAHGLPTDMAEPRTAAITSLVVVLPALPVTPTTVSPQLSTCPLCQLLQGNQRVAQPESDDRSEPTSSMNYGGGCAPPSTSSTNPCPS